MAVMFCYPPEEEKGEGARFVSRRGRRLLSGLAFVRLGGLLSLFLSLSAFPFQSRRHLLLWVLCSVISSLTRLVLVCPPNLKYLVGSPASLT